MQPKNRSISLPLKISFLVFSMVLNCMGIVILQLAGGDVSYSNLGFLEAFKDLPIAFVSLFAANFITRFGSKPSLIFSMIIVGICCCLFPFVEEFWFFKLWFAVIGVSFSLAKISVYGILRNNITNETTLAKTMSSVEASFMVGLLVVNLGFGWLISSAYSEYWKFGFLLISLLAFVNVFILSRTEITENPSSTESNSVLSFTQLFNKTYFLFLVIIFMIVFIEQNFNSWMPSFYKNHLKVNSFFALQASAFLALFSYIGRLVTSHIIQRFSLFRYFMICVGMMLMMLLVSYVLFLNGYLKISLFIYPFIGLFLAPLYPVISSRMLANIDKNEVNIFTSLIVIFSSLGSSFGSIMMSYVFEFKYGNHYAFFISLAVILLFVLSFVYFKSYVSKNENNY